MRDVRKIGGGHGLYEGGGKLTDRVFSGRPQIFWHPRLPVDDCSPRRGEWRRTAEQGVEHFMAKGIAAEKTRAGLRYAVVCPNEMERTEKRIPQSKRNRAGSLALVYEPQVARTCIIRAFGLQMS